MDSEVMMALELEFLVRNMVMFMGIMCYYLRQRRIRKRNRLGGTYRRDTGESGDDDLEGEDDEGVTSLGTQPTNQTDSCSSMQENATLDEQEVQSALSINNPRDSGTRSGTKRRRMSDELEDPVIKIMRSFLDQSDMRLDHLISKLDTKHEERQARLSLYDELCKIQSLNLKDRVRVGMCLASNTKELAFFMSCPDDAREVMAQQLLRESRD